MKCPNCNGYGTIGKSVPDILHGKGAVFTDCECDVCHGTGEVPMTNEEWFCNLSTEEKAEWIVETFLPTYGAYWVVHNEKLLNSATWVEWLKQPHKPQEEQDGRNVNSDTKDF